MTISIPPKPRFTRNRLFGGCCGCLGVLVFLVIVISIFSGGGDEPETAPTPSALATTDPAPAKETSEASPAETTEPENETTPEVTTAAGEDPQVWAERMDEAARISSATWLEYCDGDFSSGTCYINGVSATQVGQLHVTIQVSGVDGESEKFAADVAGTFFANAGYSNLDLEMVIVEDATGTVIVQKQRSDYPAIPQG